MDVCLVNFATGQRLLWALSSHQASHFLAMMPGRRRCQSESWFLMHPVASMRACPGLLGTRSAGPAVHSSWLRAAIPSGIQHAIICQEPYNVYSVETNHNSAHGL